MGKFIDLTGQKFGKLTVIKRVENGKYGHSKWLCVCECGNKKEILTLNLIRNNTISCGCYNKERMKNMALKHNKSNTRLYNIFNKIKGRCYNENNPAYKNYGGRSIKVCDEWLDKENGFINFYNWAINNGYKKNLTIDRIDVNGNYEPKNCRWVTAKVQSNNKRNNRIIEYQGKQYTLTQLSEKLGIKLTTLEWRLEHNWREKDLSLPSNLGNRYIRNRKEKV